MLNVVWVNYSYIDTRGPNKWFKEFIIKLNNSSLRQKMKHIAVFPPAPESANIITEFNKHNIEYYNCPVAWFGSLCSRDDSIRKSALKDLKNNIEIMVNILKKVECDIVISNTSLVWEAAYAAHKLGIKHITYLRGILNPFDFKPNDIDFKVLRILEQELIELCDKIVTQSSFTARLWNLTPNNNKVEVIPLGTENGDFTNFLPLDINALKILTLADIEENKNISYIIDISRHLKSMKVKSEFNIYGMVLNMEYKQFLDYEISKGGLADYIIFHGHQSDINTLILNHHIILIPSRLESFGLTAIEGASRYRPTISTKCGGPEETIIDGKTGYLVDAEDPYSASKKIVDLICNPDKIIEMGKNAQNRWQEFYNIDSIVKRWESFITTTVNS